MDIRTFHYSKVAKPIPCTVISCWPSEWAYWCIYTPTCFSHVSAVTCSPRPHYLIVMGWFSSRWATLWSAVPAWGTDLAECWLIDWRFPLASRGHPPRFLPPSGRGLLPGAPNKGNADRAEGIFGHARCVWVLALQPDPTLKTALCQICTLVGRMINTQVLQVRY